MKTLHPQHTAESAKSELRMCDRWTSESVRALITRKTTQGRRPSFLFLGRNEAELLREHLGTAFGPESVRSLSNLYYMGLQVIEVDADSYLRTAGMKRVRGLEEALGRTPDHKDIDASSFWRFAVL